MKKLTLVSLFVSLVACGSPPTAKPVLTQSNVDFISWGDASNSPLLAVRGPEFRVCVQASDGSLQGRVPEQQQNTLIALLSWYRALRQIDPLVQNNIKMNCDNADITVNLYQGGNRSQTSDTQITLYIDQGDGSILHELGHAFARLGDTYDTGTGQAGACIYGQQESVMCWGMFGKHDKQGHSLLYADDVKGIQDNYRGLHQELANVQPDHSIDPQSPVDLKNPLGNGGATVLPNGNGGTTSGKLFVKLGTTSAAGLTDIFAAAPVGTAAVYLCTDTAANCTAAGPSSGDAMFTVANDAVKDRAFFKSAQPQSLSGTSQMTFFAVDASQKLLSTQSISFRSH